MKKISDKVYIFVDDEREPISPWAKIPDNFGLVICRNYKDTIETLNLFFELGAKIIIDLDHDLGENKTGYDLAKYIIASDYKNIKFRIHTMNPVGRFNIHQLVSHYGYEEVQ